MTEKRPNRRESNAPGVIMSVSSFSVRKVVLRKPPVMLFLIFLTGACLAQARVEFNHEFAPSETWVKAPEKPLRDDISLNGSWQFQPMALPPNFKEAVDPAPELTPPLADGWEKTPLKIPSPWDVNSFANQDGQGGDFRCYPSYPKAWEEV